MHVLYCDPCHGSRSSIQRSVSGQGIFMGCESTSMIGVCVTYQFSALRVKPWKVVVVIISRQTL